MSKLAAILGLNIITLSSWLLFVGANWIRSHFLWRGLICCVPFQSKFIIRKDDFFLLIFHQFTLYFLFINKLLFQAFVTVDSKSRPLTLNLIGH